MNPLNAINARQTVQIPYRERDWLIAANKTSNALLEAIAALKIENWYALQGKRVHVDWNQATDIARKRDFDLVDVLGVKWEVKTDLVARTSQRVFIEECWAVTSKADMALIFVPPFAHILLRADLLAIPAIGEARGGDYDLARGHYISLEALEEESDIL